MAKIWGQHLVELRFVQTFVHGWFSLYFSRVEHMNWVLSSFWHIKQAPVLLRRWSPLFHPHGTVRVVPLWVCLLGLPLQLWSEDIFRRIGNSLSTYLEFDKPYLSTIIMAFVRIWVHIDIRERLQEACYSALEELHTNTNPGLWGDPFRCRSCHKVENLYKDFPLIGKARNRNKG